MALADPLARLFDGLRDERFVGRPLHGDRISLYQRCLALVSDAESLAVDAGLELSIHSVHEIVAVELGVKAENAAAEEAIEKLLAPRTDCEGFRIWPRDVPECDDRRRRQFLPDHSWHERQVVVLHQHDW